MSENVGKLPRLDSTIANGRAPQSGRVVSGYSAPRRIAANCLVIPRRAPTPNTGPFHQCSTRRRSTRTSRRRTSIRGRTRSTTLLRGFRRGSRRAWAFESLPVGLGERANLEYVIAQGGTPAQHVLVRSARRRHG